jgi:hypothetical protein
MSRKKDQTTDEGPSCRQCVDYHVKSEPRDAEEYGECHLGPPTMLVVNDEPVSTVSVVYLPYACRSFKPKVQ